MTIWNSTCNPCFSSFDQIYFVFHGLKTGVFFVIHWSLILCVTQIDFLPMTTVCGTGEKTNFNYIFKFTVIHPFDTFMFCCGYVRIIGNFCCVKFLWFWSKKKTFNFCGIFFSADCKSRHRKKNCLYYRKQQVKRCYDKQLVHIIFYILVCIIICVIPYLVTLIH
jgi:hypothetical protein